ncbi:MAG: hypothetical protein DWI21_12330 [Planctomycetota bacterium]|nr:MAG: hypothetical protein DWI21_12330 [Planctomycetota bacterium]
MQRKNGELSAETSTIFWDRLRDRGGTESWQVLVELDAPMIRGAELPDSAVVSHCGTTIGCCTTTQPFGESFAIGSHRLVGLG